MKSTVSLTNTIRNSFAVIERQLPFVEEDVLLLVKEKCTDIKRIEYYLDTLYSLHTSGFMVKAHNPLIEYLEKLNPKLAQWHKAEFEKEL